MSDLNPYAIYILLTIVTVGVTLSLISLTGAYGARKDSEGRYELVQSILNAYQEDLISMNEARRMAFGADPVEGGEYFVFQLDEDMVARKDLGKHLDYFEGEEEEGEPTRSPFLTTAEVEKDAIG